MVDWKKDVSFGRKARPEGDLEPEPTQAEAEPQAEKTSFWKKELSVGRKPKAEVDPVPEAESTVEKASVWKKDVSFGRKPKAVDDRSDEPAAEKTSFWKKELSLGRKPGPDADETTTLEEPPPLTLPASPEEPDQIEAVPVQLPPAPAFEPVLPPAAEAPPVPEPEAAPVEPAPLAAEPVPEPEPVLPPAAEALPEPQPDQPGEPVEEREQLHPVSWVDAVLHASELDAAPAPAPDPVLPPAAELPPLTVEPPPAVPAVEVPAPDPAAPDPFVANLAAALPAPIAVTPPVPVPDPVPVPVYAEPEAPVVHPPVPAAELPELPAEPKVPFWKKELGSSRKKPKEPKQAKEPKAEGASTPFWKKELGGSKKKTGAGVAVASDPSALERKKPFWKLELGSSKKNKQAKETATPAGEPAEAGSKKPLKLKRGFTLPRLVLPSSTKRSNQRHKELVGLKIGASQIAAARVSNNGVSEVLQVARENIDPGIVVGGELRDPEALAVALKEFFRVNKLPRRGIRLGIANNRIGVRTFEITGIEDPKQLANAIRFRAQEALPIPIEEAVLDYQVLSETTNEEGETVRKILLVVAYRELVDRYVAACRDAGLTLAGIDLEAFALLRSLAAPREDDGPAPAALVAVAVGHDRSTFAVSDGRVCEFTRVLDWGGSTLSVAIARALDMTPSEVEPIKRALSLEPGPSPEGISEEVATAAREAVKAQINNFARELVSSLQFYQNQPGSLGIGEIILTGGTAHLPGFAAELQRLIGVRVKLGDPLVRVKVGKRVSEPEQLGSLAIAIGLGIED